MELICGAWRPRQLRTYCYLAMDTLTQTPKKEQVNGGHTPILAMTAHAGKEAERKCIAAGMDHYISKPIDFNDCLELIGQIIRQKSGGNN